VSCAGPAGSTYGETGQATGLGVVAKVLGRDRLVALGAARARVLAG